MSAFAFNQVLPLEPEKVRANRTYCAAYLRQAANGVRAPGSLWVRTKRFLANRSIHRALDDYQIGFEETVESFHSTLITESMERYLKAGRVTPEILAYFSLSGLKADPERYVHPLYRLLCKPWLAMPEAFRVAGLAIASFQGGFWGDLAGRAPLDETMREKVSVLRKLVPVYVKTGVALAPRQPLMVFRSLQSFGTMVLMASQQCAPQIDTLRPPLLFALMAWNEKGRAGETPGKQAAETVAASIVYRPETFSPSAVQAAQRVLSGAAPGVALA